LGNGFNQLQRFGGMLPIGSVGIVMIGIVMK
jgi:hypothetical protein